MISASPFTGVARSALESVDWTAGGGFELGALDRRASSGMREALGSPIAGAA